MTGLEQVGTGEAPAADDPVSASSRIADLERDALLRDGETAEMVRVHLDR